MRIAKAIAITIGGTILGFLVIYIMIPELIPTALSQNFWLTVGCFVISAVISFVVYGDDIT